MEKMHEPDGSATTNGLPEITRRDVLITAGVLAVSSVFENAPAAPRGTTVSAGQSRVPVAFKLNGKDMNVDIEARTSLLDLLREQLGVTGAKKGCDHGQCGACTVHVDGRRVVSCLTVAAQVSGREVTTIEGLARANGELHPMQQAFIDNDALQCGYCTPGQIMAAVACVQEGHAGSIDEIREYMSGNLCRCGAYTNIVAAIRDVAERRGCSFP